MVVVQNSPVVVIFTEVAPLGERGKGEERSDTLLFLFSLGKEKKRGTLSRRDRLSRCRPSSADSLSLLGERRGRGRGKERDYLIFFHFFDRKGRKEKEKKKKIRGGGKEEYSFIEA